MEILLSTLVMRVLVSTLLQGKVLYLSNLYLLFLFFCSFLNIAPIMFYGVEINSFSGCFNVLETILSTPCQNAEKKDVSNSLNDFVTELWQPFHQLSWECHLDSISVPMICSL